MKICSLVILLALTFSMAEAGEYGWPMWRYDHGRTASTPEKLSDKLYLQWQAGYSPRETVWDDPLNENLMQYDRVFEPIAYRGKLYIGFNDKDKVVALDLQTGKELWHFYADGPVRLPLAAEGGNIYFTGDDGFCYCLDADKGTLIWKLNLAPAPFKLLGNKRMISMWPARGGIVIHDGIIYTASSIFPMMGTFIYAIRASDGKIIWKNEGTGSNYILQPHRSPAFAYVGPQGSFTISGDKLLVAGGRSVPAAFSLATGKELYYKLAESGKTGGAFTFANDRVFFNHHRKRMTFMYNAENGDRLLADAGEYPVIDGDTLYFSGENITAAILNSENKIDTLWISEVQATSDLIKAGDVLYAADTTGILSAIKTGKGAPSLLWSIGTGKRIGRLLAAYGKLIVVSEEGTIQVYGETPSAGVVSPPQTSKPQLTGSRLSGEIFDKTGITSGYAVVYGAAGNKDLLRSLVSEPEIRIIALENDPMKIQGLREHFDSLEVTAERLSFLPDNPEKVLLPKYFSSLTIINDLKYLNNYEGETIRRMYESTRPYGGTIWLKTSRKEQKKLGKAVNRLALPGAVIQNGKGYTMVTRSGPIEGSAAWTHNYGNISNTAKSDDKTVKAPLGILWFGGNSNLDVLPRHGHGPSEQVINGLLIIQGVNSISARDVYTGRVIWKKVFEEISDDTWLVYYDETYDEENPLDPKYNQVHLPGANARGTNFIATKEYVYVIEGNRCHLLDIHTGELAKTFREEDDTRKFAYIGVCDNYLILGSNFTEYPEVPFEKGEKRNPKFENYNLTSSRKLLILDRVTGEKQWSIDANHGFIHNSVIAGDGILFCLDKLPQILETKLKRRGESIPGGTRLLYLDLKTGKVLHEEKAHIFGTWLGYSAEHKLLLQATRPSRDMLNGEEGNRMIVYNTVTREKVWDKPIKYGNPPIIAGDKIYTSGEGFYLLTGEPIFEKDPVTGDEKKWEFKREYGCGYIIASEHLLTFRSASAAFVNLDSFEGTASLGGFKSGCTANLIVADGVLNAPDYTRTCQCPYQNQTSLAFINMPWMNYWTNSNYIWNGRQIEKLGLTLNAPGERVSDDEVLRLEYPNAGGIPSGIPVTMDTTGYFAVRKDPLSVKSVKTPWISSSSLGGIRSIEITLSEEANIREASYYVRLYLSEPEILSKGERIFDVAIQGNTLLKNFDILKEAGQPDKEVIKSFNGIRAGQKIKIELHPVKGNTVLSGIELIKEKL